MKMTLSLAFACFAAFCLEAAAPIANQNNPTDQALRAERARIRALAGHLESRNSMKGKIAFISTTPKVTKAMVNQVASQINGRREFNIVFEKADATSDLNALKEASKATLAIIIVDDAKVAPTLISPDQKWGVMNVAKLDAGLKTDEAKSKFLESRYTKQLLRTFSMTAGGWLSGFPGNLSSITKISDLDLVDMALPIDVHDRNMLYFKTTGITPKLYVPYQRAVVEGWAPAPTNEVQKKIWDDVHSIPSKPMQIKFDPAAKKGKVTK